MRTDDAHAAPSFSAEQRAALERAVTRARSWLRAGAAAAAPAAEPGAEPPGVLFAGGEREAAQRAAKQLARELGRELYRVTLATVVSRYVGETEKNLSRVLETAERTGAVLFFDESDALFASRTDVKDSHDRFAALDTGQLLQRLTSFPGLAILSCRQTLPQLGTAAHQFHCVVELHPSPPQP